MPKMPFFKTPAFDPSPPLPRYASLAKNPQEQKIFYGGCPAGRASA
jgi:hypothetical protein